MAWSNMTDLALTPADKAEQIGMMPTAVMDQDKPQYPYGCRISLCEKELSKLNLDVQEAAVGDIVDMRCFGVITSVNQSDGPDGPCERVEIQIQKMALENEADEEVGE